MNGSFGDDISWATQGTDMFPPNVRDQVPNCAA